MKNKFFVLVLFLISTLCLFAASKEEIKFEEKLSRTKYPYELDFKGTPLSDALSTISRTSNVTIVASSEVADLSIDLYLTKGQTLKKIIDTIKSTNALISNVVNETMILTKIDEKGKKNPTLRGKVVGKVVKIDKITGIKGVTLSLGDDINTLVLSDVGGAFIIDNVNAGTYILKATLKGYHPTGEIVEVKVGDVTNVTVVLSETASQKSIINDEGKVEGVVSSGVGNIIEDNGDKKVAKRVTLKHGFVNEVKVVLDSVANVDVTTVEKKNMLILKGTEENIKTAEQIIEKIDTPVKQVRITAKVVDTSNNLFDSLGINWSGRQSTEGEVDWGDDKYSVQKSSGINSSFTGSTFNLGYQLLSGGDLFSATLNMLVKSGDVRTTAVPSVVALNGEIAEIKITEEVVVGEEETEDDDGNTTKSPLFDEAGVVFNVKPTIREGVDEKDTILLEIVSEVSSFQLTSSYDSNKGAKQQNNAKTRVRVRDGETIFIGGMKQITESTTVNRVPFVSRIPLIGWLFKNESKNKEVRDVYIQIKADIIKNENANKAIDAKDFKDLDENSDTNLSILEK